MNEIDLFYCTYFNFHTEKNLELGKIIYFNFLGVYERIQLSIIIIIFFFL